MIITWKGDGEKGARLCNSSQTHVGTYTKKPLAILPLVGEKKKKIFKKVKKKGVGKISLHITHHTSILCIFGAYTSSVEREGGRCWTFISLVWNIM